MHERQDSLERTVVMCPSDLSGTRELNLEQTGEISGVTRETELPPISYESRINSSESVRRWTLVCAERTLLV
jgi:hypothetical protein